METLECTVVRSSRRTLAVQISRDAQILVRAPYRTSEQEIRRFLDRNRDWIVSHLQQAKRRLEAHPEPTAEEEQALRRRAHTELPPLCAQYARRMGVQPTGVKITSARTRFGSCSGSNSLCFSWRLMQYPQAAIEYVVVHELAHIVHKNHSAAFYALVANYLPDWKQRQAILK